MRKIFSFAEEKVFSFAKEKVFRPAHKIVLTLTPDAQKNISYLLHPVGPDGRDH